MNQDRRTYNQLIKISAFHIITYSHKNQQEKRLHSTTILGTYGYFPLYFNLDNPISSHRWDMIYQCLVVMFYLTTMPHRKFYGIHYGLWRLQKIDNIMICYYDYHYCRLWLVLTTIVKFCHYCHGYQCFFGSLSRGYLSSKKILRF